jgi:protein SCO1/2
MKRLLAFGLFLSGALCASQGTAAPENTHPRVGIEEKLGNVLPLDEQVYDEHGNLVTLRSVISKPTILTFVYYRCPGICSPMLSEVARMVGKMDMEPGKDYQIVTISFDHHEGPSLALEKQQNYLSAVQRPITPSAWHFFTADSLSIWRLTDAAGFYFQPDSNNWVHGTALIILSPEGKITHYLSGIEYLPMDIKLSLIDASEGKTGPTIAKVLRLCYSYDPEGHHYALNVTRIAMMGTLACVVIFALVFLVRPRKKKREDMHGTPA